MRRQSDSASAVVGFGIPGIKPLVVIAAWRLALYGRSADGCWGAPVTAGCCPSLDWCRVAPAAPSTTDPNRGPRLPPPPKRGAEPPLLGPDAHRRRGRGRLDRDPDRDRLTRPSWHIDRSAGRQSGARPPTDVDP